ncbi:MAG: ROK family protein, partial [candidate division Zixibacteria bacterium]|nr:ROK family protein [candidate division Zixibacteria bacterium]
ATLKGIVGCAQKMTDWAAKSGHQPVSVGIGSPGTINPRTHLVQPPTPNLTSIIGENLADLVGRATGLPTMIDNDANCAAWAEHCFGSGRGIDNLICITVGSGIGSGFIVDGRIFSGPNGSGGELGHVTIDWHGPRCPCGNHGCLEMYTSATALVRKASEAAIASPGGRLAQIRESSGGAITVEDLFTAARADDPDSRRILIETAQQLALGILNAVNLFDPEAVIIGGGVTEADTDGWWLGNIAARIRAHAFSAEGKQLQVGRAALGNDAGFIGAAALGALLVSGESR